MTEQQKPPNNYIIWDSMYIIKRCRGEEEVREYLGTLNLTPRHIVEEMETGREIPAIEYMQLN